MNFKKIFIILNLLTLIVALQSCRSEEVQREIERRRRWEKAKEEIVERLVKRFDYDENFAYLDNVNILIDDEKLRKTTFSKKFLECFKRLKKEYGYKRFRCYDVPSVAEYIDVKDFFKRKFKPKDDYFVKKLKSSASKRLKNLLNRKFEFLNLVINKLKKIKHVYRSGQNLESEDQAARLSISELCKVYIILKTLEGKKNVKKLSELVERDFNDKTTEMGGLVLLHEDLKLQFKIYPSRLKMKDFKKRNERYALPLNAITFDCFATFHFHASSEDESHRAGPSVGVSGDISRYKRMGLDGIVITKLEGRKFNVDFYTSWYNRGIIVDLGVYEGGSGELRVESGEFREERGN